MGVVYEIAELETGGRLVWTSPHYTNTPLSQSHTKFLYLPHFNSVAPSKKLFLGIKNIGGGREFPPPKLAYDTTHYVPSKHQ